MPNIPNSRIQAQQAYSGLMSDDFTQ